MVNIDDNNIDKKYSSIRKDLQYIKNTYGEVFDYCGGFCNCESFEELLKKPNKKIAFKILISKLKCYFTNGYDNKEGFDNCSKLIIEEDKKLQNIKNRWKL